MPAKTKAPAKAAKPAKKAPAKPAAKAPAKGGKPASKPAAKAVKKVAKAPPSPKTPVKKPSAKSASKAAPAAKKAAAKAPAAKKAAAPAPAKKAAVKAAPAKKAPASIKKEKEVLGVAAPIRKEPAKTAAKSPGSATKVKDNKVTSPASRPLSGQPAGKSIQGGSRIRYEDEEGITIEAPKKPVLPAAFLKKQRQRLVELRDAYLNSAEGVAAESLRGSEGGDSSAFGMHQADAGSDAYDRDFALSLLAKEQDAIYEINEALKRIDTGTYGICEMSGQTIPEERLEALPFTRFTVSCQERIEREQRGGRWNRPVRSLFGLDETAEDGDDDRDEEETTSSNSESLDFSKE